MKKDEKKKVGRPEAKIDKIQFENMCALQATKEEICLVLRISDKTLDRWCKKEYNAKFSEVFRTKRELGKMSLRRMQWKQAEKSATMAIWLGKQYLGQKDESKIEVETTPVVIVENVPNE